MSPRRRWLLFALVVLAGVLNYADRQAIAVLKPLISADLGWSDNDYGTLAAWFQGSAAVAFLFTGRIVDRLGIKWANPLGVAAWSLAAIGHGWARSMTSFVAVRIALGASEAMGTPISLKTIATIFPPAKRSTGFGVANAAGSVGAIVTPLVVPVVALAWGWRGAFISLGVLGLVWALVWLVASRGINFAATEHASPPDYGPILAERRTWAIVGAKILSDSTWWLMLFWMPDFFHRSFGLEGIALGPPLAIVYGLAAVGALIGGAVSARLAESGGTIRARKAVMLVAALLVLPVPLALTAHDYTTAVALLGLTLAAHQAFSTNLQALLSDITPTAVIGRVSAFSAFCGNLGGMSIAKIAGLVLSAGLGYLPLFLFASVSYLLALAWVHAVLPKRGSS